MSGGVTASSLLTTLAVSTVGSMAMKALFQPDAQTTPPAATPTVEAPPVMPTPGDANSTAAKRAGIAAQIARRGRASTILTDQPQTGDALGG